MSTTLDLFAVDHREVVSIEADIPIEFLTTVEAEYPALQGEPYRSTVLIRYGVPEDIKARWEAYLWAGYREAR